MYWVTSFRQYDRTTDLRCAVCAAPRWHDAALSPFIGRPAHTTRCALTDKFVGAYHPRDTRKLWTLASTASLASSVPILSVTHRHHVMVLADLVFSIFP